jgi:hypothetical protein
MIDPRPTHAVTAPDATTGVAALIALIEGSQILVRAPASWAPPGYDETDIRILEWIGSHRRDRRQAADLAA